MEKVDDNDIVDIVINQSDNKQTINKRKTFSGDEQRDLHDNITIEYRTNYDGVFRFKNVRKVLPQKEVPTATPVK